MVRFKVYIILGTLFKIIYGSAQGSGSSEEDIDDMTVTERLTQSYGGIEAYKEMDKHVGKDWLNTELDLILTTEQFNYYHGNDIRKRRKAVRDPTEKWPNAVMPYEFSSGFSSSDISGIKRAMSVISSRTCISFRAANNRDRHSVMFTNGRGCSSLLGKVRKRQPLILQARGCRHRSIYIHEILHALGLIHEHQRPDRDNHIQIVSSNVQSGLMSQFRKYSASRIDVTSVPYDLKSIMHYDQKAFSKGRGITIRARNPSKQSYLARRNLDMTSSDIRTLNLMYNCRGELYEEMYTGHPLIFPRLPQISKSYLKLVLNCTGDGTGGGGGNGGGGGDDNNGGDGNGGVGGGGGGGSCRDRHTRCRVWALLRYCNARIYRAAMRKTCPKSCRICS